MKEIVSTLLSLIIAANVAIPSDVKEINVDIYKQTEAAIQTVPYDHSSFRQVSVNKYLTPTVLLAISNVEWGGYNNLEYAWSTTIPVRLLEDKGVAVELLTFDSVDSFFMIANGLDQVESESSYAGALQINKDYFENTDGLCNDYYRWEDACAFYAKTLYSQVGSSVHAYTFPNEYEFVALTSIGVNTGASFWSRKTLEIDRKTYPWKDDTSSIIAYAKALTSEENLAVIEYEAYTFVKDYLEALEYGDTGKLSIHCNRYDATDMLKRMNIDFSKYLKEENVPLALDTSQQAVNEKVCHPVQVLYNYIILDALYSKCEEVK